MSNIPIEVNTGETKTITFHTAGTFNTEDIVFSISAAGGDANTTLSGVAYCSTAASTAAKKATMPGFELVTGQRIFLQTTNENSATSNVTLSVNDTEAKPIKIGTSNPSSSNFPAAWWIANYDGTNWVLTRIYLSDENTTQTYASASSYTYWRPLVVGYSAGSEGFTPTTKTDNTYTFKTITCQPSSGTIRAGSFKVIGGTSSKFLKADGTLDENTYSLSSHDHSGVYKPIQTAVSDPSVPESGTTTSTTFIDTISQDTNGVITATKKTLPAYLSAVTALSATPSASLSDKTLTFKQFSQATSAQVSAADSSTKLHFNTAPTETNKIATMSDVTSAFQVNDAMIFKGTLGTNGTVTALPAKHYQGWTYKVITAGTWAGVTCEVGDMVICITDGTSANNAHWTVVQSNIDGAVTGPASSASGNVVTFNGTTGKLIQDSGFTIGKSVPSNAEFTDTKVTSSANHYTPETASGQDKSASASGGSASWSMDVVKGVTLNTDGKGHVTGISVTSGKLPSNPNTDTKVSQSSTTTANYRKVLLAHNSNASAGADVVTETDVVYGAKLVEVQPSTGTLRANAFVKVDGSALQFLKADGSVDSSKYALESHNHDGDYQPVGNYKTTQTAVSDPSVPTSGITTSTSFIDTISQNTNGVITVTKKNLPTASTTVAGITTVGASGGAAAYSHTHSYASSSHTHGNITNAGALQSTGVDIANNDCLVVTDASNSAKVAKTTTVFDGSTTSQFLTKKGTFESLPTASTTAAGITTVGASGGAASYGHDHNGVYQPVGNYKTTQTAVSSPTAGTTTASAFIDTISQDTNGVITATKKNLPTASTSTAGIIKIGTTETTAAAGNHEHTFESLTSKPTTLAGYGITDATDTKVTQTVTGSSNSSWRPLIIGGSFSDATTFAPSTTTTTTYATHLAKFKPSTGVLGIVGLNKMKTNGTVADGSNNTLWNTNGGTTTIATVATSGSYSDLSNTPAIPTMMSELTNDVGFTTNTGTVTSVKVGTTSYNPSNGVVSLPEYPTITDIKVTQTYASASDYSYWRPLVIGHSNGSKEDFTPSTTTDTTYTFSTLTCQPSTGTIRANHFKVIGGTSSQFLKADGSVDNTSYVTSDTKASSVVVGPTSSTDENTDSTGSCFVNVVNSDGSVATGVKIIGSGSVSVSSNHDGIITIDGTSGSTVTLPASDITLSTTASTYITSGSTARKISLPSTDPYTSARTPSSHTHGNIQNGGTLQTTDITIANGDKLVVTDSSNSSKIARTSIEFDGSTTTQFLSKKGTWETVQGGSLPSSIPSSWLGNTSTTAAAGNHIHNNYISSIKAVATDGVDGSENAQSTSNVYLNIVSTNGNNSTTVLSSNKISGSGTVSVSSNSDGDITITGTGGSGGADVTIPESNITIGTTAKTYITVNSTSRSIKLPTNPPSGWLGTTSEKAAAGNHTHGSITKGGYINGNDVQSGGVLNDQVQIANGDRLVIGDFSARSSNTYHPLKLTSIAFDGSTTTQFLSRKGTWETPTTPLATPVATDEDDSIGVEGTVLPVDSIGGISGIEGTKYDLSEANIQILRPSGSNIEYLLPICMDDYGHLFLPISEAFKSFLLGSEIGDYYFTFQQH